MNKVCPVSYRRMFVVEIGTNELPVKPMRGKRVICICSRMLTVAVKAPKKGAWLTAAMIVGALQAINVLSFIDIGCDLYTYL